MLYVITRKGMPVPQTKRHGDPNGIHRAFASYTSYI
jgi:hypothetical protein